MKGKKSRWWNRKSGPETRSVWTNEKQSRLRWEEPGNTCRRIGRLLLAPRGALNRSWRRLAKEYTRHLCALFKSICFIFMYVKLLIFAKVSWNKNWISYFHCTEYFKMLSSLQVSRYNNWNSTLWLYSFNMPSILRGWY